MTSFPSKCFYFIHGQLRKASHLVVGHTLDVKKDVVVVTGGSSGLGKEIAAQFAATGVKVAVMDIITPLAESEIPYVQYFKCDVGDEDDVKTSYDSICGTVGRPTVLVNNAAIATGKMLSELSCDEIRQTIRVNLLLSFYTIKKFLPSMQQQKRGYIVTIGSVLGYMSPAQLSAYGASKAALIALHELITYELGAPLLCAHGVKTLLICPGKMKTPMFDSVATSWRWIAPELEPAYVARSIIEALQHGRRGEIKLPFYANFLPLFRAMPWPITELARHVSGIDDSMRRFGNTIECREDNLTGSIVGNVDLKY